MPSSKSQSTATRSREARKTLTHAIPDVLRASSRAHSGVQSAILLRNEDILKPTEANSFACELIIRVVALDTLQAAFNIIATGSPTVRVAVLSMASELRPGGGFLTGANSQEESLCMRTTLYPSLRDEFFRLPELGCVYVPDICVFRGHYTGTEAAPDASGPSVNPTKEWWFVDVISCAAVRGPALDVDGEYADPLQRDLVREKIKRILRVAVMKGCRHVVLGAFGCGAFGNPASEVAGLFRRVLLGRDRDKKREAEFAGCFDEVVFAIKGGRGETFEAFKAVFH